MKDTMRKAVSWIFIGAFCTAAPLLLLSALGYRYNLKRNAIQPTGALSLISIPKGVSVTLNGVLQQGTTPLRLTQLAPGNYTVEATKEGYHGWRRQITIAAGTHTVFATLRFFPTAAPVAVEGFPPADRLIWNRGGSSWIVLSARGEDEKLLTTHLLAPGIPPLVLEGPLHAAAPAPHDLALAVLHGDPLRLTLIFLSLTESFPTRTLQVRDTVQGVTWIGSNEIMTWDHEALETRALDGAVRARSKIPGLVSATADRGRIILLAAAQTPLTLRVLAGKSITDDFAPLTATEFSRASLIVPGAPEDLVGVLDPLASAFTLLPQGAVPQRILQPGLTRVQWDSGHAVWFMASEHELQRASWERTLAPDVTLLTRTSESITSHLFVPDLDAVFYTTPSRLAFVHLDPSVDQEPHTLYEESAMEIAGADPTHSRLYLKIGEQLFSYALQTP